MLTFEAYNYSTFPSIEDVFSYWTNDGQYVYPNYDGDDFVDADDCLYENKEKATLAAQDVLDNFKNFPEEIEIYRTVFSKDAPIWDEEALGNHWSYEEDAALKFSRNYLPKHDIYLLKAIVNKKDVNWPITIKHFLSFTWGSDGDSSEHEIYVENPKNVKDLEIKKIR